MARRGRPRVIDDKVRGLLLGLVGMGCSRRQAARHVGVGRSTLCKVVQEDQEFADQLRKAEMQQDITPLRKIMEHSHTSWRAAAWILERQNPNRYARRPPLLVSKADCMAFLKSVIGSWTQSACQEDQQRIEEQLERLDLLLGGQDTLTPRGRRMLRQLAALEAACRGPEVKPKGNFGTAQECPESPENRTAERVNAALEQGGGI